MQGDLAAVRANLHELIDYCASDVAATHEVGNVVYVWPSGHFLAFLPPKHRPD